MSPTFFLISRILHFVHLIVIQLHKIDKQVIYVHSCILIILQLLCIVIVAFATEITFGSTDVDRTARTICFDNPKAKNSGVRICCSLIAAAFSSIMVCMVLMIFDVLIPCVDAMVKSL